MIDLSGRAVLVTGGSRGIGRAAALLLARAGAHVGVTCHTRVVEAEAVAREARAMGRKAYAGAGDHADGRVVERLVRECRAALGGFDSLVVNHGIWPAEGVALARMTDAQWRRTLAANLDGVFFTVRSALKVLRPGGKIVLVSSTAGQRGEAFHADYAASKGAVISLTRSLAIECAPDITVNCVAPGWVDTEMVMPALVGRERKRVVETIPLGRIPPPEDIAGPIVFLVSDLARHITGEVLNVNGGSVLCG